MANRPIIPRAEFLRISRRFVKAAETLNRNVSQAGFSQARVIGLLVNQKLASEGHLERIVKRRFDSQGSSGGRSWPGLSPSTIKQRDDLGFPSGPVLERSGVLKTAAIQGTITIGADELSIEMKDGAAPRYLGKLGKFKKSRGKKAKQLSDYAAGLNAKRPFYGPPTKQEMEPMDKRKNEMIGKGIDALMNGRSLVAAIK